MILIFGGAYQGKLQYALDTYNLSSRDVHSCEEETMVINFDKRVIYGLEKFVWACLKEDINPVECLEANIEKLEDKIIICCDNSSGVVPMDKLERAWREMNGRSMMYLAERADAVTRVFCGLGEQVK